MAFVFCEAKKEMNGTTTCAKCYKIDLPILLDDKNNKYARCNSCQYFIMSPKLDDFKNQKLLTDFYLTSKSIITINPSAKKNQKLEQTNLFHYFKKK